MPIDRTAALAEVYDLEQVEHEIAETEDFVITRTQAVGKRIYRDVWLFPIIAFCLDCGLSSIYVSDLMWDELLLGTTGLLAVAMLMVLVGVVSWFLAGSIRISVRDDELAYRGRTYPLSQLCLPRSVEHGVILLRTRAGDEFRLFGPGATLSKQTAARTDDILDRLNAAIQLFERRDALRNTAPASTDP